MVAARTTPRPRPSAAPEVMRAAVFVGPAAGLELWEIPRPTPGPGEVVVAVGGCGFCHTDLHYLDHGVPTAHPPPLVLGHEIAGTIARLGPDVPEWEVGARVLLPAVLPCGRCTYCRSGRENICPDLKMFGNHIHGGFAEEVVAPARDLIRLPDQMDPAIACVIADALSTPFHAVVRRAQVRPGEWVAVVGCGGVGINAVQFAVLAGANVIAIDLRPEKLEVARKLGAAETVRPESEDELVRTVRSVSGGGVDVALEVIGRPETIGTSVRLLRRGGRVCLVGYSDRPAPIPAGKVMFFEYSLIGSLGCRPVDYPVIVDLVQRGRVRLEAVVTGRLPLARIGEAAERLRRGEGLRTVIVP